MNLSKIYFAFALVFLTHHLFAQDLTVKFVFTDALGNKDSVVTGTAEDATWDYDEQYDSPNLVGTARNTNLDVRMSNGYRTLNYPPEGLYTSKVNIMQYENVIEIELVSPNWPMSVIWESSGNTNDPRIAGAVLSDNQPGYWGEEDRYTEDAGIGFTPLNLDTEKPDSISFTRNTAYNVDTNGDSIFLYYVAFLEELPVIVSTEQPTFDQLTVFPNPTNGTLHLTGSLLPKLRAAELFDLTGRRVRSFAVLSEELQIGELPPGMYVLRFRDADGRFWSKRVVRR